MFICKMLCTNYKMFYVMHFSKCFDAVCWIWAAIYKKIPRGSPFGAHPNSSFGKVSPLVYDPVCTVQTMWATKTKPLSMPNIDLVIKFFYWHTEQEICNLIKDVKVLLIATLTSLPCEKLAFKNCANWKHGNDTPSAYSLRIIDCYWYFDKLILSQEDQLPIHHSMH